MIDYWYVHTFYNSSHAESFWGSIVFCLKYYEHPGTDPEHNELRRQQLKYTRANACAIKLLVSHIRAWRGHQTWTSKQNLRTAHDCMNLSLLNAFPCICQLTKFENFSGLGIWGIFLILANKCENILEIYYTSVLHIFFL